MDVLFTFSTDGPATACLKVFVRLTLPDAFCSFSLIALRTNQEALSINVLMGGCALVDTEAINVVLRLVFTEF